MALKFTQKEVELAISNILEDGDITKIHQITGIGYSYVDQQLNPNDSRRSCLYDALRIICAIDEIDPVRGEKVFRDLTKKRELSKPAGTQITSDLNEATADLNKEIGEYVATRLTGKSFPEQMKEFLDIEAQMTRVKQALIDEYNRLHETEKLYSAHLKLVK